MRLAVFLGALFIARAVDPIPTNETPLIFALVVFFFLFDLLEFFRFYKF